MYMPCNSKRPFTTRNYMKLYENNTDNFCHTIQILHRFTLPKIIGYIGKQEDSVFQYAG